MKQLPDIPQRDLLDFYGNPYELAETGKYQYYFLKRAKKSQRWTVTAFANSPGDCCLAGAEKYFAAHGFIENDFALTRLVNQTRWRDLQVQYHLKDVGIKR
jgi:hypothetical protein